MIMRFLILCLILLVSCSETKTKKQEQENNTLITIDTASYTRITPQTKIEVLTATKFIDTLLENYQAEKDSFINWKLNKTQIEDIIRKSEQLNVLSCFEEPPIVSYRCKILVDNKLAFCQVLKDGKTNIKYSDTTITLWYMNANFSNYFPKKFWEILPKEISSKKEQDKSTEPKPTAPYTILTPKTKIKVLTATKFIDSINVNMSTYNEMKDSLRSWTLTKNQIKTAISKSRIIDRHEWHYLYSHLPAYYSGELLINGKKASYRVDAGGVMGINFLDSSELLGYPHSDYSNYFFDGEWKPDEEAE